MPSCRRLTRGSRPLPNGIADSSCAFGRLVVRLIVSVPQKSRGDWEGNGIHLEARMRCFAPARRLFQASTIIAYMGATERPNWEQNKSGEA